MPIPICSFQVYRRHRASHPPRVSNIIRICVLSNVSWSHSHAPRRRPHVITSSRRSGGIPYPPSTTAELSHDGAYVPALHHRTVPSIPKTMLLCRVPRMTGKRGQDHSNQRALWQARGKAGVQRGAHAAMPVRTLHKASGRWRNMFFAAMLGTP